VIKKKTPTSAHHTNVVDRRCLQLFVSSDYSGATPERTKVGEYGRGVAVFFFRWPFFGGTIV
jgi:hypothetical protein